MGMKVWLQEGKRAIRYIDEMAVTACGLSSTVYRLPFTSFFDTVATAHLTHSCTGYYYWDDEKWMWATFTGGGWENGWSRAIYHSRNRFMLSVGVLQWANDPNRPLAVALCHCLLSFGATPSQRLLVALPCPRHRLS